MSLKNFHLLFITLSIVMTLVAGWWALLEARATASPLAVVGVVVALAGAVGLVWYETRFLRRARELKL
jgi:predicted membrane chloride channel (bestrophin family)